MIAPWAHSAALPRRQKNEVDSGLRRELKGGLQSGGKLPNLPENFYKLK